MGRSRSRSRSRSYDSRSRSRSPTDDGIRVHVADLGIDCSKREIERTFEKFGPLVEVWLARNPPCFAFVVFRHKDDAEDAIRDMDGKMLCGSHVRVCLARPRRRGGRRGPRGNISRSRPVFNSNLRCYTCGRKGHFARQCTNYSSSKNGSRYSRRVCGSRVRVAKAHPRRNGLIRSPIASNQLCYQCGERGHLSRDCNDLWRRRRLRTFGWKRSRSYSRSRSRSRSRERVERRRRSRSRSRSRSPSQGRNRKRSRRTPSRSVSRSRSRSPRKSRSRSKSRDRKTSKKAEKESKSRSRSKDEKKHDNGDRDRDRDRDRDDRAASEKKSPMKSPPRSERSPQRSERSDRSRSRSKSH